MNTINSLKKIELHDHLDGGLRPQTLMELIHGKGIELPFKDTESLKTYLSQARRGSLERYLSVFGYTVPAMKSKKAIVRVAREAVEDWASDGIIYGEIRMAPELLEPEQSLESAIEAMLEGLHEGEIKTGTKARLIVCAMRSGPNGERVAKVASKYYGKGVVGFDIAGKENGFPAKNFEQAFIIAAEAGLGLTVHAGEADGPESVKQAVLNCRAWRLGHGVHMADLWQREPNGIKLDEISQRVREQKIGIEVCLSSNVQTGAVETLQDHPAKNLLDLGFVVNLNTDNRLVSTCTLSGEFELAQKTFGWNKVDLVQTLYHAKSMAFDQDAFSGEFGISLEQSWKTWLDTK